MSMIYAVCTIVVVVAGILYFFVTKKLNSGDTAKAVSSPSSTANSFDVACNSANNDTGVAGGSGSGANGKHVLVLFGSQTGTAEMFAKTLSREGTRLGVPMQLCDTENYNAVDLETESVVVLICATYGEGEPTDSMKDFHDYIVDDARQPGEELANMKYAVFALGDRQYKYFCEEGIVMDRRFDELGAERIYGLHCGDSGNGLLEEEFDEWRRDLWPVIGSALHITIKAATEEPAEPECRLKYWEEQPAPLCFPKTASVLEPTQKLPVWLPVTQNEELLAGSTTRSTCGISFNLSDTIISYQAGDHLGILPHNQDAIVNDYLRVLGLSDADAEKVFSLQHIKTLKNVFPARVTIRTALKWYIDLAGPPKKSTLRAFAHYCTDPQQKEELLRILRVNPESQKEYTKLNGKLRTVHGFLRKFDSAKVPLEFFLELMPRIAPRYFSISSDMLETPTEVGITVAYVEGGLCTTMLKNLKESDRVPVFVRKSTFHLPLRHKDRPVIMVGPGTGVAPFIGFIKRRMAWKKKNAELGPGILFFGCRRREEDHIYKELSTSALQNGILSDVDVAYSREQADKVYVQHRIKSRGPEVWRILNDGGNLYICGDAKRMARDVEAELLAIAQKEGGMSEDEAKRFLRKLEEEERFLKDVWSSSL